MLLISALSSKRLLRYALRTHIHTTEPTNYCMPPWLRPPRHNNSCTCFGRWPSLGLYLYMPSPEQLAEMARWFTSAMMVVRQGRNQIARYEWFLCTTNQIKKDSNQLTFCGLRNIAAIRRLNDSSQTWKNGLQPALHDVLARHDANCKLLNASSFRQLGLLQREMPHSICFDLTAHTHFQSISPLHYPWCNIAA